MTQNEIELIEMIRNSDDVEKALCIAINTILDFLAQDEPSQERPFAC